MFGIHSFAGTAGNYASIMKLQSLWETKKEKGSYTEKTDSSEDPLIRHLKEMQKQNQENSGKEAILNKMRSGKKLTQEEMEYLQREDPAAYQKAKEIQEAQKGYRNALKNCKTKEDVQRLKATHMGATLTRVNAIANDPHIPKGKKMELLLHENAKMEAVLEAEKEFIASGAYDRLPTDAEQKEAMKQAAQIRDQETGDTETANDQPVQEKPEELPPTVDQADKEPEKSPDGEPLPGSTKTDKGKEKASRPTKIHPDREPLRQGTKAAYARGTDAYQKSSGRQLQRKKEKISRKA